MVWGRHARAPTVSKTHLHCTDMAYAFSEDEDADNPHRTKREKRPRQCRSNWRVMGSHTDDQHRTTEKKKPRQCRSTWRVMGSHADLWRSTQSQASRTPRAIITRHQDASQRSCSAMFCVRMLGNKSNWKHHSFFEVAAYNFKMMVRDCA